MSSVLLQTYEISKQFSSFVAVDKVDMTVNEGEIFGIVGPNGAGKSTLFNLLGGVYQPSSGKILFNGVDVTHFKVHNVCRMGIGRTFQHPHYFPSLTVYEHLLVGVHFGSAHKIENIEKEVDTILYQLDISDLKYATVDNLDLFSTKMVMLCSILATRCKLLLLDEPLAGLSINEIRKFIKIITILSQEKHITILIIEHLLDYLLDISDRVMVMHFGKVIYLGNPKSILENDEVTKVYVGDEKLDDES